MTTGAFTIGVEDVLRLEPELKGKYTVYWQPVTNGQHFFVNVEREPWKDLRLIRALWLATDRQELLKAMGEGKFLLGAPFPVGSWYGSTVAELLKRPGYRIPKDQDIAEAKALLKAAGYDPPATLGKRVLTTPRLEWFPDLAQLWAAQMRRNLGLDIELKVVDGVTAITAFVAGDFDIGELGYAYNIDDPDDYVNAVYGPGARNWTRWKHPEFLKMFDQQSRELDKEKRRQILRQMEEFLLAVQSPYIEVWWVPRFYLASDKVRTEAGPFITPPTLHVILKQEH
jgi:ABC-type transport system substrate-binding protein